MTKLRSSFVVTFMVVKEVAEIVVTVPGIGTQSNGLAISGFGIGGSSGTVVGFCEADHGIGASGVKLQSALVFLQSQIVFPGVAMDVAECDIHHGQTIIQLLGFLTIRQSFVDPLAVLVELIFQTISFAELRIT